MLNNAAYITMMATDITSSAARPPWHGGRRATETIMSSDEVKAITTKSKGDLDVKNKDIIGQVGDVVSNLIGGITAMGMSGFLVVGAAPAVAPPDGRPPAPVAIAAILFIPAILRAMSGGSSVSLRRRGGLSIKKGGV